MSLALYNPSLSSQDGAGRASLDLRWNHLRFASFGRLGASVEDLAKAEYEEIMGFNGEGGHRPPRPDIQKLKDTYDLWKKKQDVSEGEHGLSDPPEQVEAQKEWAAKFGMDDQDQMLVGSYSLLKSTRPGQDPFDQVVANALEAGWYQTPEEAKKALGSALKKFEGQKSPILYVTIKKAMDDAYRRSSESYKLWPWMIKQIKAGFNESIHDSNGAYGFNNDWGGVRPPAWNYADHMVDVVTEAGQLIHRLKHRDQLSEEELAAMHGVDGLPENFDINHMNFDQLEGWLMDWKRENREAVDQGQIVYKFHDGWTIQKLTTEEQLQFEGDEMGHCVGGYGSEVESGRSAIYSLRDKKGMPRVTMEIEGLEGAENIGNWGKGVKTEDLPEDISYNMERVHPDQHSPGQHMEEFYDSKDYDTHYKPTGDTPFKIVQVMGGRKTGPHGNTITNTKPDSECQHKIKEFLDSLREKGWKFERSEEWHRPVDDDDDWGGNEYEISNDSDLEDWWEHYRSQHETLKGTKEDAYGMPLQPNYVSMRDFEEMLNEIVENNRSSRDGTIHIGDYEGKAQQLYHAFWMEYGDAAKSDATRTTLVATAIRDIESIDEKLNDQISEWFFDNEIYFASEIEEAYEHLDGKYEEDEAEEAGEWKSPNPYHSGSHGKTPLDEDKWQEATDKVYDDQSGDVFKFLNYLHHLFDKGFVERATLPDPNQTNAGLPGYQTILDSFQQSQPRDEPSSETLEMPGTFGSWREAASPYTIHPIDETHNVWFDEDGGQHARYRPGWAKNPKTQKMEQTGALEDTFLDKQGRQGQGYVAYHGDTPVGSLSYVSDPNGWHMLGTTYVHPDHRQQGIFSQLVQPLRDSGRPIDAYVWNNGWLKQKVRSWSNNKV